MRVAPRKLRFIIILLSLALFATGCFTPRTTPRTTPTPEPPTRLDGTLSGPPGLVRQSGNSTAVLNDLPPSLWRQWAAVSARWSGQLALAAAPRLPGEEPLGNVPMAVFELGKLQAGAGDPLLTGETNADGEFTFTNVPTGVDLVVMTLTEPRLTTIVPSPGKGTETAINSATALAAEALVRNLREHGGKVDPNGWERGVADIEAFLHDLDLDQEALMGALQDLIPESFGAGLPGSPPDMWSPLVEAVLGAIVLGYDGTYEIEGIVFDQGESGVPGVEIAFSGDYESVFTDDDGYFYKDGLAGEVAVTVVESDTFIPIMSEWSPGSVTVTDSTWITFFGEVLVLVDPPFSVSGTVQRPDGTPLPEVEIHVRRHDEDVVTDADGAFTVSNIGLQTTVRPVMDGYVFQPSSYVVRGARTDLKFEAFLIDEVAIEFADPNLEAAARDALRDYMDDPDGPITFADAERLDMLAAWDWPISDLSGLEYFVNLDTLYIGNEDNFELTDLSPLQNLNNLFMVALRNTSVTDWTPLSNKSRLQDLYLANNQIEDISFITGMPNLSRLELHNNPVRDLSPLLHLERSPEAYSFTLEMQNTHITNVDGLRNIKNWGSIDLSGNQFLTDISGLLAIPVTFVNLRDTPALDWCDYESAWLVVETILRREGGRVFTNTPCTGLYELQGSIAIDDPAQFDWASDFYVVFKGDKGTWATAADWVSDLLLWEQQVEGHVSIEPRYRGARSMGSVWVFEPSRKSAVRPERNIDFSARRDSMAPIIEGHAVDMFGNPVPGVTIRIADAATDAELAKLTTDEYGFFRRQFDERKTVHVYAEKDGWVFLPQRNIGGAAHLRMEGSLSGEGTIAFLRDGYLYTVLPDGTGETQLRHVGNIAAALYGGHSLMAWSPDAQRIAFVVEGSGSYPAELWVVNRDGSGGNRVLRVENEDFRSPSWGNNNRILYSRREQTGTGPARNPWRVHSVTTGGMNEHEFLVDANIHYLDTRWSPGLSELLVTSSDAEQVTGAPRYIHTVSADGRIISDPWVEGSMPAWAPTGDEFAYVYDGDVYVYDFLSGESTLIATGIQPTWSPDGRYIAFQRDPGIYVHELDTGREYFVTDGTHPVWSPQ